MGGGISVELSKPPNASDISGRDEALAEVRRLLGEVAAGLKRLEDSMKLEAELKRRVDNGKIRIVYEQYDDLFDLVNGQVSISAIDNEYCLSDVMPNCTLELIDKAPQQKIEEEIRGVEVPFLSKDERNAYFQNLFTYNEDEYPNTNGPKTYWIVAYPDEEQRRRDMVETKARLATMVVSDDNANRKEGCSCIEGNPCTDANKYNCLDWNNRFSIAKKNGWKGAF